MTAPPAIWSPPRSRTRAAGRSTRCCTRTSRCSTPRLMKRKSAGKPCKRAACMTRSVTARQFIAMNWRSGFRQIGYRIRPAKHGFQIEGVSDEVLKRFSKRSQQRDAVVRELEQKLGRKFRTMPLPWRCIRAGRKRSKASRPRKCANASWRNCSPMNYRRCKNSPHRFNPSGKSAGLNRKTKP